MVSSIAALTAVVLAVSLVLRFWTQSDLWLDEALTVNVARLPLHELPNALRHDGAPPLYYVLLHFWMLVFGTGNLAVRSLAGVFGVASLPLAWLAGRRLGGRRVAWACLIVVATSPFAVRYATENRMYSLEVLLTFAGYLAVGSALRRPTATSLLGVGALTTLLLYSHYWSIYLVGVVALWLAWRLFHGSTNAKWVLLAMACGAVLFLPWVPIFYFQLRHTGTPWAVPASFAAIVHAVAQFAGGDSSPGRALGLAFFGLVGLALFGTAIDSRRIELDLRTRPRARTVAIVTAGTLAVAVLVGMATRSAFQDRYAAVVFPTFALLIALGTVVFASDKVRYGVLAAVVALGLSVSASNVTTDRTQAGQVAAAINAGAHPGDVVAYCPDQLGPAVSRLLKPGLVQLTFPRGAPPQIVDWADYAAHNAAGDASSFSQSLLGRAGRHVIWLVWAPNYLTLGGKCEAIEATLVAKRPSDELVHYDTQNFYEFMDLIRLSPQ
jgi:mannosyltransferase